MAFVMKGPGPRFLFLKYVSNFSASLNGRVIKENLSRIWIALILSPEMPHLSLMKASSVFLVSLSFLPWVTKSLVLPFVSTTASAIQCSFLGSVHPERNTAEGRPVYLRGYEFQEVRSTGSYIQHGAATPQCIEGRS